MTGYQYKQWHIVRMRVPNDVYMPIYDSVPARYGRRNRSERDYVVLSKRFVELITKGLKFEQMEKVSGGKTFEPSTPIIANKPLTIHGALYCHERPMVDYGDFWMCMVGGEKILK